MPQRKTGKLGRSPQVSRAKQSLKAVKRVVSNVKKAYNTAYEKGNQRPKAVQLRKNLSKGIRSAGKY